MVLQPSSSQIAFLGLGQMGLPMANRLVTGGWRVRGYDPAEAARDAFAASGIVATSAEEAAEGADVLVTMLPDGKVVRAALFGPRGIANRLAPRATVVDMSSSAPVGTRMLARELADIDMTLLDAPVSGGVKRAWEGTLTIMVGGRDRRAITAVMPILTCMGASVFETGPVGSGHAMKALNNYVSAAGLTAACEALRIGGSFGLDPDLMTDVLNASTGRNNSTEVKLKPFIINKAYNSGFSMGLMAKDLNIADELAQAEGVPAPLARAVSRLWQVALADFGPTADHTIIDAYVEDAPPTAPPPQTRDAS